MLKHILYNTHSAIVKKRKNAHSATDTRPLKLMVVSKSLYSSAITALHVHFLFFSEALFDIQQVCQIQYQDSLPHQE